MVEIDRERGEPAGFDPKSGEVHGSGSGAGGGGNPNEDYDQDPMAGAGAEPPHGPRSETGGTGHPLPASDEARHDEIPEDLAEAKGDGGDSRPATRPAGTHVNPDGEPYPADEDGRAGRI